MSTTDGDTPITEDDLARMFDEEDAARASEQEDVVAEEAEPEPEPEPEPVEEVPADGDGPLPTEVGAEAPAEVVEPPAVEPDTSEVATPEHLAWAARRNLTDFEAAAKLAYEQEKFLGKKASEIEELRRQLEEQPQPQQQFSEQTRTDQWIAAALSSPDPARYAMELAQAGEWGTYEAYMQNWEAIVGESVTMGVHQQIMSQLEQAAPEPEPQGPTSLADAFAMSGVYDLQNDPLVPLIKQVADGLGAQHPLVQRAAEGDTVAVSAIVEIARAQQVTQRTVRLDGTPVDDEARKAAARVTGSGDAPTRTPPKPDPLAADKEEWRRMGVLPVE